MIFRHVRPGMALFRNTRAVPLPKSALNQHLGRMIMITNVSNAEVEGIVLYHAEELEPPDQSRPWPRAEISFPRRLLTDRFFDIHIPPIVPSKRRHAA